MATQTRPTVRIPRPRRRNLDPAHPVYEIDLWLLGADPPIWRSLALPAVFTLDLVHQVIQMVMNWEESHLHSFETSRARFEPRQQVAAVDMMWGMMFGAPKSRDESRITLRGLFEEMKEKIVYTYDFGDNWKHGLKLINTHPDGAAFAHLPICLAGERAGPLEDSGGIWGYEENLEILRNPDPNDEWHQDVLKWMSDGEWDPERFDLEEVNQRLARWFRPEMIHRGPTKPKHRGKGGGRRKRRTR